MSRLWLVLGFVAVAALFASATANVAIREDIFPLQSGEDSCLADPATPARVRIANNQPSCVAAACNSNSTNAVAYSCPTSSAKTPADLELPSTAPYVVSLAYGSTDCSGTPVYVEAVASGSQCLRISDTEYLLASCTNGNDPIVEYCTDAACEICKEFVGRGLTTGNCRQVSPYLSFAGKVASFDYVCDGAVGTGTPPPMNYVALREELWINDDSITGCTGTAPSMFLADSQGTICEATACKTVSQGMLKKPGCFESFSEVSSIPTSRSYVVVDVNAQAECAGSITIRQGINITSSCQTLYGFSSSFQAGCSSSGVITLEICDDAHCSVNCISLQTSSGSCLPISQVPNFGLPFGGAELYANRGLSAHIYCSGVSYSSSHSSSFNSTAIIGGFVAVLGTLTIGTLIYAIMRGRAREAQEAVNGTVEDRVQLNPVTEDSRP